MKNTKIQKQKNIIFDVEGTLFSDLDKGVLNGEISDLKNIKKLGYQLGIYTLADEELLFKKLKELNIMQFFEKDLICALNGKYISKPSLSFFLINFKDIELDNLIYCGDTLTDVRVYQSLQCKFYYFGEENLGYKKIKDLNELYFALKEG